MATDEESLINVKEFLEQRIALVREDYFSRHKNVRDAIRAELDLPEAAFERLENMCNPKLLNPDELQAAIKDVDELDASSLSSVEFMRTMGKSPKRNYPVEIKFMKNMAKLNELEPADENDAIQTPDVVLTVQVSNPLVSKYKKLVCSEEFVVLGHTYLHELKDKISCFRDEIKVGEFSHDPDQIKNVPVLKDLIKSGYFLIESTIYNDLRGDNVDCSELVNPSTDCYCKSKYPIVKDKLRGRFTFCWCCNTLYAKWIVSNSIFSVDDPTFLCERCLRNTHYLNEEQTADGKNSGEGGKTSENMQPSSSHGLKKACDFKAFHYSQI